MPKPISKSAGDEAWKAGLVRFPYADIKEAKLRPVLLISAVPGLYGDWLVAMVSGRLEQAIPGFDEVVGEGDDDFSDSGLKQSSVIRIERLAVVNRELLFGAIGEISGERLVRVRRRIAEWILGGTR
ncbi:MAG: type II toxin-antitoxin system PemK/MazF family toxin [Gemmatimonadota bacterium]